MLGGLFLMHGVDAGALESLTPTHDAAHPAAGGHAGGAHAGGAPAEGASNHDDGWLAGHITVACVTVLASVALWSIGRGRLRTTAPARPLPCPASARRRPVAVHGWRPPWIDLCVILR